ncbi:hypothetical protein [Halomonas getboli]|uniref:hypothetical protein n=1 Tax=Halomonas getboli TaxID=2935862 RepID=UPI001FFEA9D5|nr:hypothetical protein [Halomonas getboli]MCK2183538.1 hypothetical protein [Halomonas getboli]
MRTAPIIIAAALLAGTAHAQVNRCEINGQPTWQSAPCPPGTAVDHVTVPEPDPQASVPPRATAPEPAEPPAPAPPKPATDHEICSSISETAETVMRARQNGASMREMMGRVGDNSLLHTMIMEAFQDPRFSTEPMQNRWVLRFSNNYYLQCMQQAEARR